MIHFIFVSCQSIISRIAEGGIHLPESYGKYHLSNWNIQPAQKRYINHRLFHLLFNNYTFTKILVKWFCRSSWQKNYMVAVVVSVLALVLGLSGFGTWWFWRQRHQSSLQYKPVDSIVPEQELQPLWCICCDGWVYCNPKWIRWKTNSYCKIYNAFCLQG